MTLAEIEESDKYDLEQCTGLKDESGELIYEGDILEGNYGIKHPRTEFYSVHFCVDEYCDDDGYGISAKNKLSVVVGNIHENKDLLKK